MPALIRFVPVAACLLVTAAVAAPQQPAAPALTPAGETLRAKYETMLERLRGEIAEVVPTVDEGKKVAYLKAREAEKAAEAAVAAAQQALDKANGAAGLVNHRKNKWIAGAEKGIADAKAKLAKAATDAEREAAQADSS